MLSEASIYKRALKAIEEVYTWSEYGDNDLYRIKDIVHSLDDNHWTSKQWLVDKVEHFMTSYSHGPGWNAKDHYDVGIFGGWYGLLAYLFKEKGVDNPMSLDIDEMTRIIGHRIFGEGIDWRDADMFEFDDRKFDVIVNTSCEHLDRDKLCEWIGSFKNGEMFALQSNDYFDEMSHINCSESEDEFAAYIQAALPQNEILFVGKLPNSMFDRFMVIGK